MLEILGAKMQVKVTVEKGQRISRIRLQGHQQDVASVQEIFERKFATIDEMTTATSCDVPHVGFARDLVYMNFNSSF